MRKRTLEGYLFSPVLDFLFLGGGSLIFLFVFRMYWTAKGEKEGIMLSSVLTVFLANFINSPHFGHSYQIFYSKFREKLFSTTYEKSLRARYFVVGVLLPPLLLGVPLAALFLEQPRLLGLAANVMFFFVGWHYVKQGYGMAMLDAALKKRYFDAAEKKSLLRNAYGVWIFAWIFINFSLQHSAGQLWGIAYFVLPVPVWLLAAAGAVCVWTTSAMAVAMLRRARSGRPLPVNGLIAYAVSLYPWMLIRDPIMLAWIPMFHSLQYLAVVWRFKSNQVKSAPVDSVSPLLRFAFFLALGFGLGYLLFWGVPQWLDEHVPYNKVLFGGSAFFYISWIFVNVHHYFLDTVMWRKGNPDVMQHLFESAGAGRPIRPAGSDAGTSLGHVPHQA